ncbi:MAG: hypothetical protein A2176_00915 [Spirochaetes bacterium RBG_13_51_14]|nr:MAG: hypothetical protein A2176_00915 [Spirochaetes bacterium RBG_13_51_14]
MNQEQVKEKLLELDRGVEDFSVIFSGKASKKVDGLYYPDRKEIIIHNKNFTDDSQLLYTAIHEFAHHLHHARSSLPVSSRAHTNRFWDIFHRLLFRAEEKRIYVNLFKKDKRFVELTKKIRGDYLVENGRQMKELGKLLEQAYALCEEQKANFDDYVDRELLLHRTTAKLLMKISSMNINPAIGYENMKTVAGIRDESRRVQAQEAFVEGMTPDMVRSEFNARKEPEETLGLLMEERERIGRSIETLTRKLTKIEQRIIELKHEDDPREMK